jgi:CRP-like cAMP-binding protein
MVEVFSLYNFIPPEDKQRFKGLTDHLSVEKGDYLLFEGDIQERLFLIKSGVACLVDDRGAKLRVIDFSYNNRFCADPASFSQQTPADYCIQCLSDCHIEAIRFEDLQQVFEESPATERAYRLLLEKLYAALLDKSLKMTSLSIEERFIWVMNKRPELFKLVQHKYIASYTNIDSTNFSKLFNQYCIKNGLIYE